MASMVINIGRWIDKTNSNADDIDVKNHLVEHVALARNNRSIFSLVCSLSLSLSVDRDDLMWVDKKFDFQ